MESWITGKDNLFQKMSKSLEENKVIDDRISPLAVGLEHFDFEILVGPAEMIAD